MLKTSLSVFLRKTINLFLHPCQLLIILENLLLLALRPLLLHIEHVGALNHITTTRPNLTYAVNLMSQLLHSPTFITEQFMKRILCYVKGIINLGSNFLSKYYEFMDYVGYPMCRMSGYSMFQFWMLYVFGPNCVSWNGKKQPTVVRSSAEAEYRSMIVGASEITRITSLFRYVTFVYILFRSIL